jgi:Iap family predicted aminopeptidase
MWANVAVLDGVQLSIRGDVYGRLVATRRPEEILHAVRAALEAVTAGRVRQ